MRATTARTACTAALPSAPTSRARSTGRSSPRASEHVGTAARDQAVEHVVDAAQRRVSQVDLDVVPLLEAERACAFVRAEAEQRLGGDDVAAAALPPRYPFELAQFLERVDADVRVRAD